MSNTLKESHSSIPSSLSSIDNVPEVQPDERISTVLDRLNQFVGTVPFSRRSVIGAALGATGLVLLPGEIAEAQQVTPEFSPQVIQGVEVYGLNQDINDEPAIQRLYEQFENVWENQGGKE